MTYGPYERLMDDHHGPGAEVAIIIRHPDGHETTAAVLHDATVLHESAADIDTPPWPGERARVYGSIDQFRITTTSGYTVYDPSFFAHRPGIEGPR